MTEHSHPAAGVSWGTGPEAIFVIRHAEKPSDAAKDDQHAKHSGGSDAPTFGVDLNGNQNPDSLIPQGWQRAGGLAQLFDPSTPSVTGPLWNPTMIAAPKYGNPPEHRTYQTVFPLAQKSGLQITVTVDVGKEADLADWLLAQDDQTVLVCWEHDHIQDLTTALAAVISGGDVPGPWPGERFDLVVALVRDAATPGSFRCVQVPQLLLAGDSTALIPPA